MPASSFVKYEHHGEVVSVREDLKGKHREHCLCYNCELFKPGYREESCKIANALFTFDVLAGLTTPVWECPAFVEK